MTKPDLFVSRFSPNRTDPEVLDEIHVERHGLLQDALRRTRASLLGKKRKHQLFVGARGSGKTHLLSLLVHRLGADKKIAKTSRIAWLNEDETSLSYAELLVRVYRALINRYPDEFAADTLEEAFQLDAKGAAQYLESSLVEQFGKRKLLVLVENFDGLLSSLDEAGQREWRAFLQDSAVMVVVATAQRLTEGMKEDKTFYGFFTVEHMRPFDVDEASLLLQRLAKLKEDYELEEYIRSRRGQARVRALHYLSGGNPRLFIVLSEFITKDAFEDLVGPFEEMVDVRLTPYYQERLRWLSAQQRRLVEVLCQNQAPMTVAELAKKVFTKENTVSGQLKKLREMGYVESTKNGRESFYELKEPLMRLSMQVKETRDGQPLKLLIDFLKIWFEQEELEKRLGAANLGKLTEIYLHAALEDLRVEGPDLRHRILRRGVADIDLENCTEEERARLYELAEETKAQDDLYKATFVAQYAGEMKEAIEHGTLFLQTKEASGERKAEIFSVVMNAYLEQGNPVKLKGFYEDHINKRVVFDELLASAFIGRAIAYNDLDLFEEALEDVSKVIEALDVAKNRPRYDNLLETALEIRIFILASMGKPLAALPDYKRLLDSGIDISENLTGEKLAIALHMKVQIFLDSEEWGKAKAEAEKILALPEDIVRDKGMLRWVVFACQVNLGNREGAAAYGLEIITKHKVVYAWTVKALIDSIIMTSPAGDGWAGLAKEFHDIFMQAEHTAMLGEGLVSALAVIQTSDWTEDRLDQWMEAWNAAACDDEAMQVGLRLMNAGINYLKTQNRRELLRLPKEERGIVEEILGLGSN